MRRPRAFTLLEVAAAPFADCTAPDARADTPTDLIGAPPRYKARGDAVMTTIENDDTPSASASTRLALRIVVATFVVLAAAGGALEQVLKLTRAAAPAPEVKPA